MAKRPGRNHGAAFKAKVALEAIKGEQTLVVKVKHSPDSQSLSGECLTFTCIRRSCIFIEVSRQIVKHVSDLLATLGLA